jgi:hypothetical protein
MIFVRAKLLALGRQGGPPGAAAMGEGVVTCGDAYQS